MAENTLNRRRELLGSRLIAQVKTYNRKLLIQNINIAFFIIILIPVFFLGTVFLLGYMSDFAIQQMHSKVLIVFKELLYSFVFENNLFHSLVAFVGASFLILLVMYHLKMMIRLSDNEMKLAAYVLAKTNKYDVISFQTLAKEIEFRCLTFDQINKVALILEKLKHVNIAHNPNIEISSMIKESDW